MKYICIRQQDEMDCGAACLASVAGYYGLKMPVARLRRLAGTDREGTSIYGLVKAAEKLGFTAKGMKGEPEALLAGIPLPAIAHVIKDGNILHFMVIYEISAERVTAADPARGIVKYNFQDFVSIWTGALIFIEPGSHGTAVSSDTAGPGNPEYPSFGSRLRNILAPAKNRSCSFSCSRS